MVEITLSESGVLICVERRVGGQPKLFCVQLGLVSETGKDYLLKKDRRVKSRVMPASGNLLSIF